MGRAKIDISGIRFGRVVASHTVDSKGNWMCFCDCGKSKVISSGALRRGATVSCGCYQSEVASRAASIHKRKHGMDGTPVYKIWVHMRQRCQNPKAPNYRLYGGRGISVCQAWWKFENFLSDMGDRPSPEYSIDRIDSNGDYEPSNCRWATKTQQSNNSRTNRRLEHKGMVMTMAEWASKLGMNYSSFSYHIYKGRTISDILGGEFTR